MSSRIHPGLQRWEPGIAAGEPCEAAGRLDRSACAREALLGGRAEEEPGDGPYVAGQEFPKGRIPALREQGRTVLRCDLPWAGSADHAHMVQAVETPQDRMGALEAPDHHGEPAGNKPGGEKALRVHLEAGSPEPGLPGLTAAEPQEQGPDHRVHCVLVVGDQMYGKERKGLAGTAAQGAGDGDGFLFELREQLNGVSLVRGDLPVASGFSADGADRTYGREDIDFSGKERFLVFPNGLAGGMVRKLNLSAPCPQGSMLGCHAIAVLPCGAWLNDQGQFLTSLVCLPSYHRSDDSGNRPLQTASIVLEITPLSPE